MSLKPEDISRIIEMAWEDRTPFEAIEIQYNLSEEQVIKIMRTHLKSGSFKTWRERVSGRKTKHLKKHPREALRHVCPTQTKRR